MDLEKLFKPKSMAVVGISKRNHLSPGRIILLKNEFEMDVVDVVMMEMLFL